MRHSKRNPHRPARRAAQHPYLYPVLAFLFPFCLMWICFAVQHVFPFGSRQILVVDGWHQYYPFLVEMQAKLQSGDSLLYTWNNGLGTNFLSLASYYCLSPLNLLTLLVPASGLRVAYTMLVALKLGAAGLFCSLALRGLSRRNDISLTLFGCFYALSAFFMGYYWNIMWLDTAALLPLVALGILSLVREGRFRLYVISLALALLCNYLIGLYVCIFTFFAFFLLCICCRVSIKDFFKRFFQIGVYTLIALSLTAFALLPAFSALGNANSASASFPSSWKLHESFLEILGNLCAFVTPTKVEGLPNIYCGVPCILLLGLFFASRKILLRQKLCGLFMLLLLLISINVNRIEFIWNGFHVTNMLPYRFSFLISFVLVVMAFQALPELFSQTRLQLLVMYFTGVALIALCYFTHDMTTVWRNVALIAVYLILIALLQTRDPDPDTPKKTKLRLRPILSVLLCLVCGCELICTAAIGVDTVGTSDYDSYPTYGSDVTTLLDTLEESDNGFYRLECIPNQTLNDPSLLGYRGISTFSSSANVNVSQLMIDLGFAASRAGNRYYNTYLSTPLNHALLGLKYFVVKNREAEDLLYLNPIAQSGKVTAYENTAVLPVAFMTPSEMTQDIPSDENPFVRQNSVFAAATGLEQPLFDLMDIIHVDHRNFQVLRYRLGAYTYTPTDESGDGSMKFNYQVPYSGQLYFYVDCDDAAKVTICCNEEELATFNVTANRPYIACGGFFEEGELANVRWELEDVDGEDIQMKIFVAMLNESVFQTGLSTLSDETLQIQSFSGTSPLDYEETLHLESLSETGSADYEETQYLGSYSSTSISGVISVKETGYFYTSIPYESGWTLYVDGQKTDITPWQDAFVGAENLTPGTHTIRLKYIPAGFLPGAAATVAGLALFVFLCLLNRRQKNKILAKKI